MTDCRILTGWFIRIFVRKKAGQLPYRIRLYRIRERKGRG